MLNIAVIFGGRSVEHEISIISAHQCIEAIDKNKYNVTPIYISKEGHWYTGDALLKLENFRNLEELIAVSQHIIIDQNAGVTGFYRKPLGIFTRKKPVNIDLAFPVMHGTYGEDGSLQGLFEIMNIPYVGCDVLSSACTMDKTVTKMLLQSLGVKVLDYYSFYSEKWFSAKEDILANIKRKFPYPLIVKPGNLGSSIGVAAASDDCELEEAVDLVTRLSYRVLVESKLVNMREIHCSVLGDRDSVLVSVCEEPTRSSCDILSYQDKYGSGAKNKVGTCDVENRELSSKGMSGAKRKIPADLPNDISTRIQEIAKSAFIGLNCNGVVRIDFLMDQDNAVIYLCELNAMPGSLASYFWELLGISFTDLTERLINLALKRHRENNNLIVSYKDNILAKQ